ncbi:G5 domain-containing protein [Anaerosalibacter bizertensis]|uniref:3D domain-containing protein n=1 Tax=Anaerosalibacter bizertensis TaxID=932217 RepID=UPI001C0EB5A2|nr:3D domain-containing protein [Anaerosalibacter bizertensis]MBU5294266.1 G5 domain-containing protein [Anaerosalibacter bizertensis]
MEENSWFNNRHLKILTILTMAAMLVFGIYKYETKKVTISIDDNKKMTVKTLKGTVGEVLKKENIQVEEGSYIEPKPDTKIKDGDKIIIKKPKTYKIKLGKRVAEMQSTENVVKDILKDLDIKLDEKDYTKPDMNKKVKPEGQIEIVKVVEKIDVVKNDIPFENIVKNNNKLEKGKSNIVQEGKKGVKEIKIKKVFENGNLISEDIISEEVVSAPVSKVVEKGVKEIEKPKTIQVASRGSTPSRRNRSTPRSTASTKNGNINYKKAFNVVATAYDLSFASCGKNPGEPGYGITASGTRVRPGVVSVDPRVIPLGTRLYVESLDGTRDYGFAVAEDTGGAIKGNRIDLFFPSSSAAKAFGRRQVRVYILK